MDQRFPDDLDGLNREIDRLWAKVGSGSIGPIEYETPMPPDRSQGFTGPLAWEAVSLLKKQHRSESRGWSEMLEARDQALIRLKSRLVQLESENAMLRDKVQTGDARVMEDGLRVKAQLEQAMAAYEADRRQRDEEARALRALLEQTRQRLHAEDARWKEERRAWEKKEQQYLIDLRELQGMASRYQEDMGRAGDERHAMGRSLDEAKNALEKTLAELLRERQVREESQKEREGALKKVADTEKHLQELSKIWDEERAQWRELWDRERSTWEAQREEFSSWEARLRQEREKWHADLQAKEQDQLRFTEEMTRTMRDAGQLSERMANVLRNQAPPPPPKPRKLYAAVAAAALLLAVSPFAYKRYTRVELTPAATHAVVTPGVTGLAFDGTLLWLTAWEGRLIGYEPVNLERSVKSAALPDLSPYRPSAIAYGGEFFWTLDAAQARLMRHRASDPARVEAARGTPGPAPTALAFDGQSLWSFDAANRSLYQHGLDEGKTQAFSLEPDVIATAMAWIDGRLWVFDAKKRQILDFAFKDGTFRRLRAMPMEEPVLAMAPGYSFVEGKRKRQLWTLVGPAGARQTPAVVKHDF